MQVLKNIPTETDYSLLCNELNLLNSSRLNLVL